MNKLFIDVETTGQDPWSHSIIQIAGIVTDQKLNKLDAFDYDVKPEQGSKWDAEAQKVHGKSFKETQTFVSSNLVLSNLIELLMPYAPMCFVSHSYPFKVIKRAGNKIFISSRPACFDYQFVFAWFWKHELRHKFYKLFTGYDDNIESTQIVSPSPITTKKLAQQLYGIPDNKLGSWLVKLGIDPSNHHDALFDAEVCLAIYKYQQKHDAKQEQILGF